MTNVNHTTSDLWRSWWDKEAQNEYGFAHQIRREPKLPGLLIVFVHGWSGDCRTTFKNLPVWLSQNLKADFDARTFMYPTLPWQKADVEDAGLSLRTWLKERAQHHRHLFFITHSTGALVVKRALLDDQLPTFGNMAPNSRFKYYSAGEQLIPRTRAIFNCSPAHEGTTPSVTRALKILMAINWAMGKSGLFFLAGVRNCSPAWGHNEMHRQLFQHSAYALDLETKYLNLMKTLEHARFSRPISFDLMADADIIVQSNRYALESVEAFSAGMKAKEQVAVRSDSIVLEARGTHPGFGSPKSPTGLVIEMIASRLRQWLPRKEPKNPTVEVEQISLADRTVLRCEFIDSVEGDNILLGQPGDTPSCPYTDGALADVLAYSQAAMLEKLDADAAAPANHLRRMVITGGPGVGKSLVLRRLAHRLAIRRLKGVGGALPILVPLQQVTLRGSESLFCTLTPEPDGASRQWQLIRDDWCVWTDQLAEEYVAPIERGDSSKSSEPTTPSLTGNWVDTQLSTSHTVLILDGLDEFVANHDRIEPAHLQHMLDDIIARWQSNNKLTIIMGMRSRESNLRSFAGGPGNILEVMPPTVEQAEAVFHGTKILLNKLPVAELQEVLLSPFYLRLLAPVANQIQPEDLASQERMTRKALRLLIERLWVSAVTGSSADQYPEPDHWIAAAMVVAWEFFRSFLGQLSKDEVMTRGRAAGAVWIEHLTTSGRVNEAEAVELQHAFTLLSDERACDVLLNQTVFVSIGGNRYRFRHRIWEDYLASRYLALCVTLGNVSELRHRAFDLRLYRMTGEILERRKTVISRKVIDAVGASEGASNQAVAGNFAAVIGNSAAPLDDDAVDPLFRQLATYPPTALHVALNSLSHRALRSAPGDVTAPQLRKRLLEILGKIITDTSVNSVTRSLGWCYLKELVGDAIEIKWPGLEWPRDAEDAILLSRAPVDLPAFAESLHRSTQMGFLRYAEYAQRDPRHLLAAGHYLFALAVAFNRDRLCDPQLRLQIPVLIDSCEIRAKATAQLREVVLIYEQAHRILIPAK